MALGGFFGAFANMISGLATSSMQRADNEYLMNYYGTRGFFWSVRKHDKRTCNIKHAKSR
nr:MAG TPA: hypothetical protein [Microviridae sp.]